MTEELSREDLQRLRKGDSVRIELANGLIAEGPLDQSVSGNPLAMLDVTIGGRRFDFLQHAFFPSESDTVSLPDRVSTTPDEVVSVLESMPRVSGRAVVTSVREIATKILGFDPVTWAPKPDFGGKSPDAWLNQHFELNHLKKVLAALVSENVIRKVEAGTHHDPSEDRRHVYFGRARTGYVTVHAYNEAVANSLSEANKAEVVQLRRDAERIVAERHRDEVEAELARLIAERE